MEMNNANLYLMDEVMRLRQENDYLKRELQASDAIKREMLDQFQQGQMQNDEEKKLLFQKIENLKSRICGEDCLCCVMVHICENELGLGVKICCSQLRTIFLCFAFLKQVNIALEDIKCAQLMEILKKCKVVEISQDDIYEYLPQMVGRENEMGKAFDKLMTMNPTSPVVIIGRLFSKDSRKGHAELCYLNTRTQDGRVTIYDPQENTATEGGKQDFIYYVKNDEGVEYYTVNLEILKQIMNYFLPILHLNIPEQQFNKLCFNSK